MANQIAALAALSDPVRRRLYEFVSASTEPVSRDQAAKAAAATRALAAFHLDKLVDSGLLETSFRRLTGRSGPGAGRPSKHYSRSALQVDVSLPARRYEWAAQMLARALADVQSEESGAALRRSARAYGEGIGRDEAARGSGGRPARAREVVPIPDTPLQATRDALASCGFEPVTGEAGEILLRNCPFDRLREDCREMICGMNQSLIEGMIAGLGVEGVAASLEPAPGRCCVVLRAAGER